MKLKVTPGDFKVDEEADVRITKDPRAYAVYRLTKSSWDTFDLVGVLAVRMGVPRDAITIGGIKDRYGSTTQLIAVRARARLPRLLREKNFNASLAGYADQPLSARSVRGNRFRIVLRDMPEAEVGWALGNIEEVRRHGFPNYYDDQRFGSARHKAGFMGKEIFLGRREEALKLYFTPSKHDDQKTRKLKKCVTANWGKWADCLPLGFAEYGKVLSYLAANPRAHHKALELIDRRFLVLVTNAYQSFLFNEILARYLRRLSLSHGFAAREVRYSQGSYLFPEALPEDLFRVLKDVLLPVPGHDSTVREPEVRAVMEEVLTAERIRLEDLRVRQMQRLSAHGVERAMIVQPEELATPIVSEDELYHGRKKMELAFFLPRGSYATILVKRLMLPSRQDPGQ